MSMPKGRCRRAAILAPLALLGCALSACHEQSTQSSEAILPISPPFCEEMKLHQVLGTSSPVGCQRLRLIRFAYLDFENNMHEDGEIVVMDAAAKHVLRIFDIIRERQFPLAKARTMDKYDGDDERSMIENNTSAFNDRPIAGSQTISIHAYGLAID